MQCPRFQLCLLSLLLINCSMISTCRCAEIVRLGEYGFMFAKIPHFLLKGQIEQGDAAKIDKAIPVKADLDDGGSTAILSFDSLGGNMQEGIGIGKLLARRAIATLMRKGERCESACALAFLGGRSFWPTGGVGMFLSRYVEPGTRLGFHSPSFDADALAAFAAQGKFEAPVESTRVSLKTLAAYLEEMGVGLPAVIDVMDTPISKMNYINSSNELLSFNINSSPVNLMGLSIEAAIHAACEKMVAAKARTRLVASDYIDRTIKMFSIGNDDFFGFDVEDILYIQFACGVHLTEEESSAYRAKRLGIPQLKNALAHKIANLYTREQIEIEIAVIASDDGGSTARKVSTLRISSGPWSTLAPASGGVQGYTSYYPLAYWLLPGNVPLDQLRPVQDDWGTK